jgi:hypothetical protein
VFDVLPALPVLDVLPVPPSSAEVPPPVEEIALPELIGSPLPHATASAPSTKRFGNLDGRVRSVAELPVGPLGELQRCMWAGERKNEAAMGGPK